MTTKFDNFLDQFHSSGSQKADGYNLSHFEGLSEQEKNKAFNLLESELTAPGVSDWLVYLDKPRAITTLTNYVNNYIPNKSDGLHRALNSLFKATGDKKHLNELMNKFQLLFDWEKEEAVWVIHNSPIESKKASEFYENIILSESNPSLVTSASDFFLRSNGVTCNSKEESKSFFDLRNQLCSDDIRTRTTTLAKIKDASLLS